MSEDSQDCNSDDEILGSEDSDSESSDVDMENSSSEVNKHIYQILSLSEWHRCFKLKLHVLENTFKCFKVDESEEQSGADSEI